MRISDWSSDVCSSDLLLDDRAAIDIGGVHLVPYLDLRDGLGRIALPAVLRTVCAERVQDRAHIVILGFAVGMDDVAHMDDQVEIGRASWRERVCQFV